MPAQPGLERTRLADAVRHLRQRIAATAQILLVVDDLQDVDDESLEILHYALADRLGARIAGAFGLSADRGATLPAAVRPSVPGSAGCGPAPPWICRR